jgi:hypothetical protein
MDRQRHIVVHRIQAGGKNFVECDGSDESHGVKKPHYK